jgi:hypothetical protein
MQASFTTSGKGQTEDAPIEDESAIYDVLEFADDYGLFLERTDVSIVFNKDF